MTAAGRAPLRLQALHALAQAFVRRAQHEQLGPQLGHVARVAAAGRHRTRAMVLAARTEFTGDPIAIDRVEGALFIQTRSAHQLPGRGG